MTHDSRAGGEGTGTTGATYKVLTRALGRVDLAHSQHPLAQHSMTVSVGDFHMAGYECLADIQGAVYSLMLSLDMGAARKETVPNPAREELMQGLVSNTISRRMYKMGLMSTLDTERTTPPLCFSIRRGPPRLRRGIRGMGSCSVLGLPEQEQLHNLRHVERHGREDRGKNQGVGGGGHDQEIPKEREAQAADRGGAGGHLAEFHALGFAEREVDADREATRYEVEPDRTVH